MSGKEQGPCPCTTSWTTGEYHVSKCPEAIRLRDSWCTPADLAELLPEVDLDPATNPRSKIKAKESVVWEHDPLITTYRSVIKNPRWSVGDGLKRDWNGSIFLNGPYSDMLPWAMKANEEWGAGRLTAAIFLVKLDPTTQWWRELVRDRKDKCLDLWLPKKRQQHIPPPRIRASTNNFASAIVYWRRPMKNDFWDLRLSGFADLWT